MPTRRRNRSDVGGYVPTGDIDYDLYLQTGASSDTPQDPGAARSPATRDQLEREWVRRRAVYRMEPYEWRDITRLNLFVHIDEDNKIQAVTRRISTDIRYCVNVDAACIAAGSLSIQIAGGREADEARADEARAVWAASGLSASVLRWATNYATQGLGWIEPVRRDDGKAVLVWHTPETVTPVWDGTGTRLVRAVIAFDFYADPVIEVKTGSVRSGSRKRYVKVYTDKDVNTYIDGVLQPDESGPHKLGRVPLVRVEYHSDGDGELPGWSGAGLEAALALVDSATTQIGVVGARHASPIMLLTGARFGGQPDIQGTGKTLSLPEGMSAEWLEAELTGLATVLDNATKRMEAARATAPQFLFAGAGANASGEALVMLTTAFSLHLAPLRRAFYSALATALSMATAIQANRPWSDADDVLTLTADEPIKGDRGALVSTCLALVEAGLIRRSDAVRMLQTMDLAPEGDAEVYAVQALAESQGEMREGAKIAATITGRGGAAQTPAQPRPAQDDPSDEPQDGDEAIE